jgi:hypothetical protein
VVQILGEGKPENQNHAMIFCFSEAIQTVDMNQENHLAEAFKMRNLLQARAPPFVGMPVKAACFHCFYYVK